MKQKLLEIQSMHEQREIFGNPDVVIKKGIWIEILEFNPDTEQIDIKHRWEVEKVIKSKKGSIKKFKVVCKVLDFRKTQDIKEKLAQKVLKKHSKKLKASFAKCLIDGISSKTEVELKGMLNKMGGDNGN